MRITQVLGMPQMHRRLKDASWQRWRKRAIVDIGTEKKLQDAGITVVDANEFVRQKDKPLYPADWRDLDDAAPRFPQPPKNDRTNPDWHDSPRMLFDWESFPIEGVDQAQVLTKSVQVKKGLPDSILECSHFTKFHDQDIFAERAVKQAFLWDAYLDKLPNLKHLDYPSHNFRIQFGTPAKRSNEIVIRNFMRLIESKLPEIAKCRVLASEEELRLNFIRHGDAVQVKVSPITTLLSKTPLSPYLDPTAVVETEKLEVPVIYPFTSTANIESTNIYKKDDRFAFKPESPFPYAHTGIFSHHIPGSHTHIHPRWNDNRFSGTTIIYNFGLSVLMARRIYGNNVSKLPAPVTTQAVHVTGKEFQFAVFQLNTLDLENTDGTKNVVWLSEKMQLFSKIENKLGKEIFEGYNPEVFKTLLGMYCSPCSSSLK